MEVRNIVDVDDFDVVRNSADMRKLGIASHVYAGRQTLGAAEWYVSRRTGKEKRRWLLLLREAMDDGKKDRRISGGRRDGS